MAPCVGLAASTYKVKVRSGPLVNQGVTVGIPSSATVSLLKALLHLVPCKFSLFVIFILRE